MLRTCVVTRYSDGTQTRAIDVPRRSLPGPDARRQTSPTTRPACDARRGRPGRLDVRRRHRAFAGAAAVIEPNATRRRGGPHALSLPAVLRTARPHRPLRPRAGARRLRCRLRRHHARRGRTRHRRPCPDRPAQPRSPRSRGRRGRLRGRRRDPHPDPGRVPARRGRLPAATAGLLRRRRRLPARRRRRGSRRRGPARGARRAGGVGRPGLARRAGHPGLGRHHRAVGAAAVPAALRGIGARARGRYGTGADGVLPAQACRA